MVQLGYSEIRDTFLAICGADRVSGRRTPCYSCIGHQFSFYATDRSDVGDAVRLLTRLLNTELMKA